MNYSSDKAISFLKLESLVVYLDDALKHVPEMNDVHSRRKFSVHARRTLYKIWNFAHGLDIDEFCEDDGSPTPSDGGC